jgi:hypothetical protein
LQQWSATAEENDDKDCNKQLTPLKEKRNKEVNQDLLFLLTYSLYGAEGFLRR